MSGIFLVTFNVPYDHENLLVFNSQKQLSGVRSPFIIAMAEAGFFRLANAANGFFIFATWSCALSNMYGASRILYSLALNEYMPELRGVREKLAATTNRGVPKNSIIACTLFGFLGFLNIGEKPRAQKALDAFIRIGTTFWVITLKERAQAAHPRDPRVDREFGEDAAREARRSAGNLIPNGDFDIEDARPAPLLIYAYKSHFQPYRSWFGILATSLFIIFNGWWVFVGRGVRSQWGSFVSCYIATLVFILLWVGTKVWRWIAGEGPPALNPDKERIEAKNFLTATLEDEEPGQEHEGPDQEHEGPNWNEKLMNSAKKVGKKIWWWAH
ncbi:hypothetical protein GP486_001030 [Trichoglossum hirsutum]|uniref:Amino acid permease/ SLC12A domain-containing protein n=1 Tax=Trichoglossum hirsutum TaxID=265104 RepID=A0A9P8LHP2_9PEZI|nr:hypothetical protein GP486_001030 [Trichoglossum hirsutum]